MSRLSCVLIGAGHAHVEVIRRFAAQPAPGVRLTVINPGDQAAYTGMAPGFVAGKYAASDIHIDLAGLAARAGAALLRTRAVAIDRGARQVHCADAAPAPFDVVSINIGGVTRIPATLSPGAPAVYGVKPAASFLAALPALFAQSGAPRLVVAGGGFGGIEIAAALALRGAKTTLVCGHAGLAPRAPAGARRQIAGLLEKRRVQIIDGVRVSGGAAGRLFLEDGRELPCDAGVFATGLGPPALLERLDAPKDDAGFMTVTARLHSPADPYIFGVGDCARLIEGRNPGSAVASGVNAVRQGPVLDANLRAALAGRPLRDYHPPTEVLSILSFWPDAAIAIRGRWWAKGPPVEHWKTRIDKRFMARYQP